MRRRGGTGGGAMFSAWSYADRADLLVFSDFSGAFTTFPGASQREFGRSWVFVFELSEQDRDPA